jgi:hypothetical protein
MGIDEVKLLESFRQTLIILEKSGVVAHSLVIQPFSRQKQEESEFKASLGCTMRPCLKNNKKPLN